MNSNRFKLLYIGDCKYLHHDRFIEVLSEVFEVKSVFVLEDFDELQLNFHPDVVMCAPLLEPLIFAINNFTSPIIGICWAQELNEVRRVKPNDSDYASALSSLSGIVTDNSHTISILRNSMNFQGLIAKMSFNLVSFNNIQAGAEKVNAQPTFISARRFESLYRNDLILAALKFLSKETQLRLTAIGGGSQLAEMKEKYDEQINLGLFTFTGPLSSTKTLEHIGESDFYISAAKSDGISVTLLEAMSIGKICIVPDFPSNLEAIENGVNGFLFKNGDIKSLISQCRQVIMLQADERKCISKNAMQTIAERYNPISSRNTLIDFVKSIVG